MRNIDNEYAYENGYNDALRKLKKQIKDSIAEYGYSYSVDIINALEMVLQMISEQKGGEE